MQLCALCDTLPPHYEHVDQHVGGQHVHSVKVGCRKATASKYYLTTLTEGHEDPKWDFNATASSPGGGDAKDTSTTAIAASAMLELAVYTPKPEYHHVACCAHYQLDRVGEPAAVQG
jgi:hypothetical protein